MRTRQIGIAVAILVAGCAAALAVISVVAWPAATPTVPRPTGGSLAPRPALASANPTVAAASPVRTPAPSGPTSAPAGGPAEPALEELIGQKLMVRMDGSTPSAELLDRIGRGEVGGVILFGSNITTPAALVALTTKLRDAARAGGQPALLIAVDQEGGSIKRIPWAPPTLSPPEMGDLDDPSVARAQGASTGAALRALGIDVDLAPVADVPGSTASFMYRDGRTFSFDAARTAALADAFASGLASEGVLPAMKHFPGIGLATRNTDAYVVTIRTSAAGLAPGLVPYQVAIGHGIPLIMLSNATYTAYDPRNAAGWSPALAVTLLRRDLGFTGVTLTDSLDGTAHSRRLSTGTLALRAARAGTDMILVSSPEKTSRAVYALLLREARAGSIPIATLHASYDRILALKAGL